MTRFKTESLGMRFFKKIGMEGIAWSLRRLHVPVDRNALVLDIGSGGNPYPRANVLLDAYEDTIERFYAPLVKDRPIVFGMGEKLPFKSKSFDFIIASHVLEHSLDPDAFLKEIMRVGKGGYIETPDAFFERINPYRVHRLEVTELNGKIRIFRKPSWRHDTEIVDLYEKKVKDKRFIEFISAHPEPFHIRFYWSDNIDFEILNPEVNSNWPLPIQDRGGEKSKKESFRSFLRGITRLAFSQNRRNKKLDLFKILICPVCSYEKLEHFSNNLSCSQCRARYTLYKGIPHLFPVGDNK